MVIVITSDTPLDNVRTYMQQIAMEADKLYTKAVREGCDNLLDSTAWLVHQDAMREAWESILLQCDGNPLFANMIDVESNAFAAYTQYMYDNYPAGWMSEMMSARRRGEGVDGADVFKRCKLRQSSVDNGLSLYLNRVCWCDSGVPYVQCCYNNYIYHSENEAFREVCRAAHFERNGNTPCCSICGDTDNECPIYPFKGSHDFICKDCLKIQYNTYHKEAEEEARNIGRSQVLEERNGSPNSVSTYDNNWLPDTIIPTQRRKKRKNKKKKNKTKFALPQEDPSQRISDAEDEEHEECSICYVAMLPQDRLEKKVRCRHTYHSVCLKAWKDATSKRGIRIIECPLCGI